LASALYKNALGTFPQQTEGCLLGHEERSFQSKQSRESVMQNRFSIPFLCTLSLCIALKENVSSGCGLAAGAPSAWASAALGGGNGVSQRDSGFPKLCSFHMAMKPSLLSNLP